MDGEPFVGLQSGPAIDSPDLRSLEGTMPSSVADAMDWFGSTREVGRELEREADSTGTPTALRPARGPLAYNPPADQMSAEDAEKKYGITGTLSFLKQYPAGVSEAVAKNLYGAALERLDRADIARRAPSGFFPTAARLGAGFVADALDPLSVAATFIPVVGEARYAKWLLDAGGTLGRLGVRAGVGAARGLAGTAPLIALHYDLAQQEQADYSAADAMLDLAYGAGIGGVLHAGIGPFAERGMLERHAAVRAAATEALGEEVAIPPAASPIADAVAQAPLDVRQGAMRSALAALGEDRPVQSGLVFEAHEAASVSALPVIERRAIELLAQERDLRARQAAIGVAPELAPQVEARAQGAAERLAAVRQVESALADPTLTGDERRALSERRDELLTDTNHETLAEQAAPLEQRRTILSQQQSITERLQDIADERARLAARAALSELPRVGGAVEVPRAVEGLPPEALRAARAAVAGEPVVGLSPEQAEIISGAVDTFRQRMAALPGAVQEAADRAARPPLGMPGDPLPDPADAAVQRAAAEAVPKGGPRTAADPSEALKAAQQELDDTTALLQEIDRAGLLAKEEVAALQEADQGIAMAEAQSRGAMAAALCLGKGL